MQSHWYVAYVRSRSEKKVAERLTKNGIDHYLPLIKTIRQWSDRKKMVSIPLFNGYIFLYCTAQQLSEIRLISGVVNYIYHEGKPAVMPEKEITAIKQFLDTGIAMEAIPDHFSPGEQVRITFGPLAGTVGELVAIENEKQFLLRITVIQQALVIKVPAGQLEKI
jgi:transcription antitermination factor NusG